MAAATATVWHIIIIISSSSITITITTACLTPTHTLTTHHRSCQRSFDKVTQYAYNWLSAALCDRAHARAHALLGRVGPGVFDAMTITHDSLR
jgi:hypothetical protein